MYLVYLPHVGRPSKPLIQKHVGRGSSCIADDEEETRGIYSMGPRRLFVPLNIRGPVTPVGNPAIARVVWRR